MIVDYDHELSVLNSECQYTFVDFDNACYNHVNNTGIDVENPFKLITGMPATNFVSCSEKIHAPSMQGLTAHAHVLLRWTDMYHRIQRQPELARAISDNPDPDGIDKPNPVASVAPVPAGGCGGHGERYLLPPDEAQVRSGRGTTRPSDGAHGCRCHPAFGGHRCTTRPLMLQAQLQRCLQWTGHTGGRRQLWMIGDSNTRKRYCALLRMLGVPIDEQDILSLGSFEAHTHHHRFANGVEVAYSFWKQGVTPRRPRQFQASGDQLVSVINLQLWAARWLNRTSYCR